MKNKEYIIFDLDGTIIDSEKSITGAAKYALKQLDIIENDQEELRKFIGPPLKDTFSKNYGLSKTDTKKAISHYREYSDKGGVFENTLFPQMEHLLKELYEAGKKLFVATTKLERYACLVLEEFGLTKYFTFVAGALPDSRTDKKELINYVLQEENITKDRLDKAIMIGDHSLDIKGANKVGIDSIAVTYGFGNIDEIEKAKPTYIVSDVKEIIQLLL